MNDIHMDNIQDIALFSSQVIETQDKVPEEFTEQLNHLERIPTFVLIFNIFCYINIPNLVTLSTTCKKYRELIFSKATINLWNDCKLCHQPLELCIDGYCPICKRKGSSHSAFSFLAKCPAKSITMHCFINDIPSCLKAIAKVGLIEKLALQLTNQSTSPSLQKLLLSSNMITRSRQHDIGFQNLTELVLDSSHLRHIECSGREMLLEILGKNLRSLSFLRLSPNGKLDLIICIDYYSIDFYIYF